MTRAIGKGEQGGTWMSPCRLVRERGRPPLGSPRCRTGLRRVPGSVISGLGFMTERRGVPDVGAGCMWGRTFLHRAGCPQHCGRVSCLWPPGPGRRSASPSSRPVRCPPPPRPPGPEQAAAAGPESEQRAHVPPAARSKRSTAQAGAPRPTPTLR